MQRNIAKRQQNADEEAHAAMMAKASES